MLMRYDCISAVFRQLDWHTTQQSAEYIAVQVGFQFLKCEM